MRETKMERMTYEIKNKKCEILIIERRPDYSNVSVDYLDEQNGLSFKHAVYFEWNPLVETFEDMLGKIADYIAVNEM